MAFRKYFMASMVPLFLRESRSEEHTSELQSQSNLVCRLLLEKKKKHIIKYLSGNARTARRDGTERWIERSAALVSLDTVPFYITYLYLYHLVPALPLPSLLSN